MKQQYNWIFQKYDLIAYNTFTVEIDLYKCNGLIIFNGSLAFGDITIFPAEIVLTAGDKFSFTGNELEEYNGKIVIVYQKFFGNINPNFTVIKKYLI